MAGYDSFSAHRQQKLTPGQRDEILRRLADGESARDLALEFGVSTKTIRAQR